MKKRYRVEFTVEKDDWSEDFIKESAIQELECMVPFPQDITFSEANSWYTGTPTEEGDYLCAVKQYTLDLKVYFVYYTLKYNKKYGFPMDVTAWWKIELYTEASE